MTKASILILSDISKEPDDTQSLRRYLSLSNHFNTKEIIAATSTCLRDKLSLQAINACYS